MINQLLSTRLIIPIVVLIVLIIVIIFLIRQFPKYTLRTKLLILFISVSLIPLSVLILVNYISTRNTLTNAANQILSTVAIESAAVIDRFIDDTTTELEQESELNTFRQALQTPSDNIELMLSDLKNSMNLLVERAPESLKTYALLDRDGGYLTSIPEISSDIDRFLGLNPALVNGLQIALIANVPYISPVVFDKATGEPQIYFATSINSEEGEILGLLIAIYDTGILQEIILERNGAAGEDSYGILFDENNIHLAHGVSPWSISKSVVPLREGLVESLKMTERLPDKPMAELTINNPELEMGLENSREQPFFTIETSETIGRTSQVAVHRLSSRPWNIAFFQPQEIFLGPANQQTQFYLLIGILFAGIVILAAFGASRLIGAPITNLTNVVDEISSGDLSRQVDVTTQDEIGRLGIAFNSMTDQLRDLLEGLESQIADRTSELERRAVQLQTAAEVARDASTARDLESLLNNTVDLINQHFGFYHAGIFLLEDDSEFALLRAANSEGGKQMIAEAHKLRVGEVGIVGDTTETGRPHIALDVGADAAYFAHPLLPETRSEMALPLRVGNTTIGALDVQSRQEGAFDDEDIIILQVLADQLAVAIRNSQLLAEVQQTVNELQAAYGDYTRHSWREWSEGPYASGYRYTGTQVESTEEQSSEVVEVWQKDQPILQTIDNKSSLAIPIRLRNITLGVINLNLEGDVIPEEMINLVNEIADRLALALENARLLATTQQRAAQEQLIGGISTRIRETLDVDAVLKTAVQEIRGALELQDIMIQLESPRQNS